MRSRLLACLLYTSAALAFLADVAPAKAQQQADPGLVEEYCQFHEKIYFEEHCYEVIPISEGLQYVTRTIPPNLYTISTVEGSPATKFEYSSVSFSPVDGASFTYVYRLEGGSELAFEIGNNADSTYVSSCRENGRELAMTRCWQMTRHADVGMAMFRRLVSYFDL